MPSAPEPIEPGILHAQVDPRSGHVDVVADQLYRTVGTSDEAELATAEAEAAVTLTAASAVLRDAHIEHRDEGDGLLVPLETWDVARQELASLGWTVLLTD